jgi:probable rRNA maturation factor
MSKKIIISVTLTDDAEIRELNKSHLQRDYPTDVLSFKINEKLEDGSVYLGDVVVSQQQASRQAKKYGNDKKHEIAELVGHGVLHLLGVHHPHDDDEDVHGIPVKRSKPKGAK